jgi:hypothetical protein
MLVSWFITLRSSVAPLPLPTYHPCAIMRENTLKQRLYAGKAAFPAEQRRVLQTMRQAAANAGK